METLPGKSKPPLIGKEISWLAVAGVLLVGCLYSAYGFFVKKEPYLNIPISFSPRGIPCIEVKIEKEKYWLELDSGGDFYFSLEKKLIDNAQNKKKAGNSTSFDLKGTSYESSLTYLDLIEIGKIMINNVSVKEENFEYLMSGSVLNPPLSEVAVTERLEIPGRVGARFLKGIDFWLIDFPYRNLMAIRNIDEFKKKNRDFSKHFAEANLEEINHLFLVSIETELGIRKFVLDTGASRSILRTPSDWVVEKNSVYTTNTFKIGSVDFGPTSLYLYNMNPMIPCDGLIGRDFFKNHAVLLDFKNNKAYFQKEKVGSTESKTVQRANSE